ncbi:MAG: TfuA-like protein [Pseudomonadota bacterium]
MTEVVFAGPSLFGLENSVRRGIELRPPARSGDLLDAVMGGATTIGLVDGVFGFVPSVWHKEILVGLDSGVRILGAASMGALRAAECSAFGMEGLGRIFEDYRDGVRWADADVAVLHAPAELDFQPLTIALADIDATVQSLRAMEKLSAESAAAVHAAARGVNFRERTWETVLDLSVLGQVERRHTAELVEEHFVSQKQQDCKLLIEQMKASRSRRSTASLMTEGPLNRTDVLVRLEHQVKKSRKRTAAARTSA